MITWFQIVFIVVAGLAVSIPVTLKRRKSLSKYWARACTGSQWKRRFPIASKSEIRAFLDLFVGAFLFRRKHRLSFSPDDQVMDVYRASYPPGWSLADAMELEFLTMRIQKTYGVDIVALWRKDITLGDLFAFTQNRSAEASSEQNGS